MLKEFINLSRQLKAGNDALFDMIGSCNLDSYVNSNIEKLKTNDQEGGTCWANAIAGVYELSMKRIIGRKEGYPDFFKIR